LLVRHSSEQKPDYGHWLLPAGKLERGEDLEEALRREMGEELGLSIRIVRKLIEHVDPYTGDRLTNFLCVPKESKIEVSSELAEARWFDLNEVKNLSDIHPDLKQFLIDSLEHSFQDELS
jgi:8-oxo-dGTP pyrophosphatase MutT (NUDIX family)